MSLTKPPHPLLIEALPLLGTEGQAVDLGCGVGHTSLVLGDLGWRVLGIDSLPQAIEIADERTHHLSQVQHVLGDFRTYPLPDCDLVTAFNALFFVPNQDFWMVWDRIRAALRPGGLFLGQILGDQDDWASPEIAAIRPSETDLLLAGFEPIKFEHVVRPGKTVFDEPKAWDVYHCILKRT